MNARELLEEQVKTAASILRRQVKMLRLGGWAGRPVLAMRPVEYVYVGNEAGAQGWIAYVKGEQK